MIRIAVVDDYEATSRAIKKSLDEYDFKADVEVDAFVSGAEMMQHEIENHYQIVIMDIELSPDSPDSKRIEDNGMYLATKIKDAYPETAIIYITGTINHVAEVLQHEPYRYISKPFEMEEVCLAVSDAMRRIINSADQMLFFQTGHFSYGLNMKRIQYFVSNLRKITAYSLDDTASFYEKMDDLEMRISKLTDSFIRSGKSYLVNIQHIKKISGDIELYDGTVLPVSRRYKDDVMRRYEEYINKFRE